MAALGLSLVVLLAGKASAASTWPSWLGPQDLSPAGQDAFTPQVALDPARNEVAVWALVLVAPVALLLALLLAAWPSHRAATMRVAHVLRTE